MREQGYFTWAVRLVRRSRELSKLPATEGYFESGRRLTGWGCHFGNPSDPSATLRHIANIYAPSTIQLVRGRTNGKAAGVVIV